MIYPNTYRRKNSLRLINYDYSKQGLYFLTLCVQNRLNLFGHVENQNMVCNPAGHMAYKWYDELENKYPTMRCHDAIVMPNHFHCIIEILDANNVRAFQCGCPNEKTQMDANNVRASQRGRPDGKTQTDTGIPTIMEWFKTMTTNEYIKGVKQHNWPRFDGKLWQRSYYDHIIRNDESYERIRDYIINNPKKWDMDKLNFKNK